MELKVRFWDTIEKKMLYQKDIVFTELWQLCFIEQQRFIPMLWTGLYDKNNNEIYDGDILADDKPEFEDEIIQIKYDEQKARFYFDITWTDVQWNGLYDEVKTRSDYFDIDDYYSWDNSTINFMTITGNIWENK